MKREKLYVFDKDKEVPGWELDREAWVLSSLPLSKLIEALLKPDREGTVL